MKEKIMKQEKGITLIALVITIIVLLILAGVAISMLSGENGILKQAGEAKTKNEEASFIEKVRIATMGAITNENVTLEKEKLKEELINNVGIEEKDIIDDGCGGIIVKNPTKDTEDVITINKDGSIEEMSDIDKEFQDYFDKNNLPYKCRYGYITGIDSVESAINLISEMEKLNYEVWFSYDVDDYDDIKLTSDDDYDNFKIDDDYVKWNLVGFTGVYVRDKNGNDIARWLIWCGDLDNDKELTGTDIVCAVDSAYGNDLVNLGAFEKLSRDLNHDGEITGEDVKLVKKLYEAFKSGESEYEEALNEINQNVYANNPNKITKK